MSVYDCRKMPELKTSTRGRPRTITPEKIADIGIQIGLPNITFVGVAEALGVSHMALYKHVPSLAALKHLIAEEIFQRWYLPLAPDGGEGGLQLYMQVFTTSVCEFVKAHPGVTPYVIRRMAATEPMLEKIDRHQIRVAEAFGISKSQSRWLLATVTFFCISAADTIYSAVNRDPSLSADQQAEQLELEQEFMQGVGALIEGALLTMYRQIG